MVEEMIPRRIHKYLKVFEKKESEKMLMMLYTKSIYLKNISP